MRVCPRCRAVYAAPVAHCGLDGEKIIEREQDPLIGEVLERYRIVDRVGQGAMGIVYRATHTVISRDYAIKVLFGELASDETIVARLRREAQAASKIRHPNVVEVEDFGSTTAGLHFLVMELVLGRTLYEVIKREGPFSPVRAAAITRQLASGLAEAHRLGFVHRDLKPSNVMLAEVDGKEHAKLLDFGVVAVPREEELEGAPLTALGALIGTPMYMAPEQSESEYTPAVDLYALGVILFEMLDGAPPFTGRTKEVLKKHLHDAPPPLPPSGGLEALASALLEKDPKHRPASAVAVVAAIDALDLSLVSSSPPPTGFDAIDSTSPDAAPNPALDTSPSLELAERDAFDMDGDTAQDVPAMTPHKKPIALITPQHLPIERVRGQPATPIPVSLPSPLDTLSSSEETPRARTPLWLPVGALMAALLGALTFYALRPPRETIELVDLKDLPPPQSTQTTTIAAIAAIAAIDTRPPPISKHTTPRALDDPRLSVLDVDLQQALSEHGLSIADLDDLGSVAPIAKHWKLTREGTNAEEAIDATKALISELERTQIGVAFLKAKLKRIGDRLASIQGGEHAAELEEMKQRAAQISAQVKVGLPPATYDNIAIRIAILDDDLRRLTTP